MTDYSPTALDNIEISKVADIFKFKTPSLARIEKHYGSGFVKDYISLWILEINDNLNISQKMNKGQIETTARLILQEHRLVTVSDVKYVFDKAMSGAYGDIYNRLDSVTICRWFRKHWEERLEEAEKRSEVEHHNRKAPVEPGKGKSEKEAFKEAFKRYKKEQLNKK